MKASEVKSETIRIYNKKLMPKSGDLIGAITSNEELILKLQEGGINFICDLKGMSYSDVLEILPDESLFIHFVACVEKSFKVSFYEVPYNSYIEIPREKYEKTLDGSIMLRLEVSEEFAYPLSN